MDWDSNDEDHGDGMGPHGNGEYDGAVCDEKEDLLWNVNVEDEVWRDNVWKHMLLSLTSLQVLSFSSPLSLLSPLQRKKIEIKEKELVLLLAAYLSDNICWIYIAHTYSDHYRYYRDPFLCGCKELYYQGKDPGEWIHQSLCITNPFDSREREEGITRGVLREIAQVVIIDRADRLEDC